MSILELAKAHQAERLLKFRAVWFRKIEKRGKADY